MTERRYYYSDELQGQAQLLDCRPLEDGNHALVLDGTLFHPQGGGQPADGGSLNGEPLLRLAPHGDDILHVVARPQPPGRLRWRLTAGCARCMRAGTPPAI
ncbi:alanyl-tRNA synthetase [Serratia rubidaea]|uniref:Alanyl-tRNA synthetase n=1 Tax=Serratia rubidaea TaxID=61652 RepID=A0A3S4H2Y7_SERRU|nr:alanyl-tRNA synthetase [Serratia rubidaea]